MTRIDSTKVMWRVQVRDAHNKPWRNKGLFETRSVAREEQARLRDHFGWRNTRHFKYVKGVA